MNSDMINFDLPKNQSSDIKVIGVGGGGSNAVNYMFSQGIEGVDFIVCNTDSQALDISPVANKIQLGVSLTNGRGAGSVPAVGKNAAIEDIDKIKEILEKNTQMLFITAGMGGGTGTGAAPIIAKASKELGILTVGIVTVPFAFEGRKRKLHAEEGLKELKENVDSLIVICNDKLRELYGNLSVTDAFSKADNVLTTAAKGIAEIITITGGVNVDFEDVKTVMTDSGVAIMGSGYAEGENRAIKAVEMALSSPLLNDNHIKGASNILLNIISGKDEILMDEITEITDYIQDEAGSTADIIWGYGKDESLANRINVTVVATCFKESTDLGYNLENRESQKVVLKLEDNSNAKKENKLKEESENEGIKLVKREKQAESSNTESGFTFQIDTKAKVESQNVEEQNFAPKFVDDKPTKETFIETSKENKEELDVDLHGKAQEREQKLRELSLKLRTPEGLQDLEKEPAYLRRKVTLNKVPASHESHISRYTLKDGDGKTQIKSNNSFLHDNVD